MALVTLSSDSSKEASATLKPGKGIEEILYFPKVAKDLGGDPEDCQQEVWPLEGLRMEKFKEAVDKYDIAASNLAEAQHVLCNATTEADIEQAKANVFEYQEKMRELLVADAGENGNDSLTPLPELKGKELIECIGFVNKRTYYVSSDVLKIVEKTRGKKDFRIKTSLLEDAESKLYLKLKTKSTDSDTGEADDLLETKFLDIKAAIQKEWKFVNKQGQLRLSKIDSFVTNDVVKAFLKSKEAQEKIKLIDDGVKYFNDNATVSYQQFDKKKTEILKYLDKENKKFGHHEWSRIGLRTQDIWNTTDSEFVSDIQLADFPSSKDERDAYIETFNNKKLPDVTFDASAGAQVMRYSANAGGVVDFNLKEGKFNAALNADAKVSLLEAGADFNYYIPNQNGKDFTFNAPVFLERYEQRLLQQGLGENVADPMFAHDSTFALPSAIMHTTLQLKAFKQILDMTPSNPGSEILIGISGYTDTTGSEDYNLVVSYQRAKGAHALFTSDKALWKNYFDRGIWGDTERDYMMLSDFMLKNHPEVFRKRFIDAKLKDQDGLKAILKQELKYAIKTFNYPVNKIVSNDLRQDLAKPQNVSLLDGDLPAPNLVFPAPPEKDEVLIKTYQDTMRDYMANEVMGIDRNDFRAFYIDTALYPVVGLGETKLKKQQNGRLAANRRIALDLHIVEKYKDEKCEVTINLGKGRLKLYGQVTGMVGASVALSGALELNTYNGSVMAVAKKTKDDSIDTYENGKIKPYEKENELGNVTASAKAFVGAKAEAALGLAVEWNNPEKKATNFELLASVGGSVTGTAGAGIEGEFRIGYDSLTKTFQVKMKAEATWGIGGGGALSLTIGAQELYDFVVLVYHRLSEHDFNFVDIFEDVFDSDDNPTESKANVFELYTSWLIELWQQGDYLEAVGLAVAGFVPVSWFTLVREVESLIQDGEAMLTNQKKASQLIVNVLGDKTFLQFTPPKVKGRMLYFMAEHQRFDQKVANSVWGDFNKDAEEAAKKIIFTVKTPREFKEMMEHYFPNTDQSQGDVLKMMHSLIHLGNELLNDSEDWNAVEGYLTSLKGWEAIWNDEFKPVGKKKETDV